MGFTGAHMLYYVLDIFILALYLLSHVCALLEYTFQQKGLWGVYPEALRAHVQKSPFSYLVLTVLEKSLKSHLTTTIFKVVTF